jgi:uncharacterized protein (DUF362 family)
MENCRVSLSRCPDYQPGRLQTALREALAPLGGLESRVAPGQTVLLKPNFIMPRPVAEPAIPHPALVLAVAEQLLSLGARVAIGDSPAWGSIEAVARNCGLIPEIQRLGVELWDLNRPRRIRLASGHAVKVLQIDRRVMDADVVINLPKVKVHCQLTMSGAVKNLFGCIGGRRKAFWHFRLGRRPERFAAMLLDNAETIRPTLTLADGIVAMDRHGPTKGDSRNLGLILAGTDCTAVDRVLAEIMGIDPKRIPTLEAARQRGLPGAFLEQIEIAGVPLSDAVGTPFTLPEMQPVLFSFPRIIKGLIKQVVQLQRGKGME